MPKTNDNLPRYSESKMAEFQLHCACAELIFKDLLRDLKVSQRNTKVSLRIKNETETTEHYELVHVAFKLGLLRISVLKGTGNRTSVRAMQ